MYVRSQPNYLLKANVAISRMKQVRVIDGLDGEAKGSAVSGREGWLRMGLMQRLQSIS